MYKLITNNTHYIKIPMCRSPEDSACESSHQHHNQTAYTHVHEHKYGGGGGALGKVYLPLVRGYRVV